MTTRLEPESLKGLASHIYPESSTTLTDFPSKKFKKLLRETPSCPRIETILTALSLRMQKLESLLCPGKLLAKKLTFRSSSQTLLRRSTCRGLGINPLQTRVENSSMQFQPTARRTRLRRASRIKICLKTSTSSLKISLLLLLRKMSSLEVNV